MRHIGRALFFALALAEPADAQEVTTSIWGYRPFPIGDLGGLPPSLELLVTIPTSDRFAVEPFVTVGWRPTSRGPEALLGVQVRQRLQRWTTENRFAFASYGGASSVPLCSSMEGWESYPAVFGQVGFGLHQLLSEHVAVRPEVQVMTYGPIPIGARFVIGLSVGRYDGR